MSCDELYQFSDVFIFHVIIFYVVDPWWTNWLVTLNIISTKQVYMLLDLTQPYENSGHLSPTSAVYLTLPPHTTPHKAKLVQEISVIH